MILISLDTVRADTFAVVAEEAGALSTMTRGGVWFDAAVSPTPLTLPAHATLLSGVDPDSHGVRNNGQTVPERLRLLPEVLREHGFGTQAVISAFPLDPQFGLDRGFERYDSPTATAAPQNPSAFSTLERRAGESVAQAIAMLDERPQPQFLWLHLFDAHAPYDAPGSDPSGSRVERYTDEIRYVNRQLARLLEHLDRRGRPYLIVLVGDHGEGLGEHGELDHGLLLYDSTLLVPMVWYAPWLLEPRRVRQTPRLADVTPTLYAMLGIPAGRDLDGVDLGPLLRGEQQSLPPAYAETHYPTYAYGRMPLRSLRESGWKLIDAKDAGRELYDLAADPDEQQDRSDSDPDMVRLETLGVELELRMSGKPITDAGGSYDRDALRKLQSLGYLAADSLPGEVSGHPLEVVERHRLLIEAQEALGAGDDAAAERLVEALLAQDPRNGFAAFVLGAIHLDRRRLARAEQAFRLAVDIQPDNSEARFRLGETLMRQRSFEKALVEWQALEVLEPERTAVWTNQAGALAALGQWQEAWIAIQRALALEPDDPAALENGLAIAERLALWKEAAMLMERINSRSAAAIPPPRLLLAWIRAGGTEQAERVRAGLTDAEADHPVARLVNVLLHVRQQRTAQAVELAGPLSSRHPALWNSATREFPELRPLLPADRAPAEPDSAGR